MSDFTIKRKTLWISKWYSWFWMVSDVEPKWDKDLGRWNVPGTWGVSAKIASLLWPGLKLPESRRDLIQVDPDGKVTGWKEVPDAH